MKLPVIQKVTTRSYFKNHIVNVPEVTRTFSQPKLSANGTFGGSSFAVASSVDTAYKAFDSDTGSYCNKMNGDTWIAWSNPIIMYVTKVQIQSSGGGYMPRAGRLEYSDNNSTWTTAVSWSNSSSTNPYTITSSTSHGAHKYWRIYTVTKGTDGGNSDYSNIVITGTEVTTAGYSYSYEVSGTESDHTRYEDKEGYVVAVIKDSNGNNFAVK